MRKRMRIATSICGSAPLEIEEECGNWSYRENDDNDEVDEEDGEGNGNGRLNYLSSGSDSS